MTKGTPHRQRAELTFKFNRSQGRHGWLRLTPAYSLKLVHDILDAHGQAGKVLDPFSGTSTTPLAAACHGICAVGYEINPFLTWFGRVKCLKYDAATLKRATQLSEDIAQQTENGNLTCAPPSIHKISRWWDADKLEFLCRLKASIHDVGDTDTRERDLILIGFCRLVIGLSNAAFNHQSLSFKDESTEASELKQLSFLDDPSPEQQFLKECGIVFAGAEENPTADVSIMQGDARTLKGLRDSDFDLLITSPPYPNRMSYIRELRPYMYWLDYLHEPREAGELDWQAIGGTWGIATSRLTTWKSDTDWSYPAYFRTFLERVKASDNKNGMLLTNYVAKYFEDIWEHLKHV